ncbi:MAG: hypothetical protein ACP5RD_04115 [bacterium]
MKNFKLNNKKYLLVILGFLFLFFSLILFSKVIFSDNKWKLKIKGQDKEVFTNPIIKGTNVFIDIYDLSNLFNIDYEINLTRKYIMFYKNPNLNNSNINILNTTNTSTTSAISTSSTINTNSNDKLNNDKLKSNSDLAFNNNNFYFSLNKFILKEINSIKNIVIINPINEIKPLYKDSIVYKDELNNIKEKINDSFLNKLNIPIIVDKNQNINSLDLKDIIEYLSKKNISGAIIPIVRAYEYHEKSENIMNPEVQLIIDYVLINNKGDILFFDSENIIRGLAVFSSSSTRYRKSKLLDLIDLSVNNYINNFNRYKEIISK